jgi:phosphoribosylformylglycinamidine (FGAM) synthase-like amidotransferase family enzyme
MEESMRKVLVMMGDGINSENELALAFSRFGAEVRKIHVNELMNSPKILLNYQILAIPGGFSFGDEIRSGKILAEKMREILSDVLSKFKKNDGRIIGICNGFQVLAQLGAFNEGERSFTLLENSHGQFMDKWVEMRISEGNTSPWFKNLTGSIFLPVRHKEGRVITKNQNAFDPALIYETDVNGSFQKIAGITDKTGNILGLMPHPEVACFSFLHPFRKGAEENAQKINQIFFNGLS